MVRAAFLVAAAFAASGLAAPAQAQGPTLQQAFDLAQAAADAGETSRARAEFTALLARFPANSQSRAAQLVRARLGGILVAQSEAERAEPMLRTAIAAFDKPTPADRDERAVARQDLARALELMGRLREASAEYAQVVSAGAYPKDSAGDVRARVGLARSSIWADPALAVATLDALLALPPETVGGRDSVALLQALRGRVALNNGDPAAAKDWLTKAARTAGGATTTRLNVSDVRIRGDLALANYLLGNMEDVQKAIAYAGAGTLAQEGLTRAARVEVPDCAPLSGIAPDAMAVVEFAIADDGRVVGVTPVYATPSKAGAERPEEAFVAAVRRWFWNVEEAAKIEPFWRQAVRVELRCMTAGASGDASASAILNAEPGWFASRGITAAPDWDANDAKALPAIRAELARREAADGPASAQLIPALMELARNGALPDSERDASDRRLMALLEWERAPIGVRTWFALQRAEAAGANKSGSAVFGAQREAMQLLLGSLEAGGEGDSQAAMLVRLRLGEVLDRMRKRDEARALFDTVIAEPETRLPVAHPIRTEALLRRSNLAAAERDVAAAADALASTGLTPEQCSTVDVRPSLVTRGSHRPTFPGWRSNGDRPATSEWGSTSPPTGRPPMSGPSWPRRPSFFRTRR